MRSAKKRKQPKAKNPARVAAGRKGGLAGKGKPKTMTPAAVEQRQNAAALSTGPKTPEGKAASSRNRWITGEHSYVQRAQLFKDVGMGQLFRPCKSTCPKFDHCSLVLDGYTQPGGDCKDSTVYVEVFDAIMDTLHSGDVTHAHGLLAAQVSNTVAMLQRLFEEVQSKGPFVFVPIVTKDGATVPDPSSKEDGAVIGTWVRNPLLNDIPKFMHELGINLPELLATPKAVTDVKQKDDENNAAHEMVARLGRIQNPGGPVRPQTYDVEPEVVVNDD